MNHALALLGTLSLLLTGPAAAQTVSFVETFDGSNVGAWTWGTGNQGLSPINGNPGGYLQDLTLFTCCPLLGTQDASPFTGDYRAKGVVSVGVDLITLDADFGIGERPLTAMLVNDNGTPGNFEDDWGAMFIGEKTVPQAGVPIESPAGWTDFDFALDAASSTLPDGWTLFGTNELPGGVTWDAIVTDVDSLEFYYGVPGTIYLFNSWDVGLDNARIAMADCNGNGIADPIDIGMGTSTDFDGNGTPDDCDPLSVDGVQLSLSAGGTQSFALDAGAGLAGEIYWIVGSVTGTSPGLTSGGVTLPLNFDVYTQFTLELANLWIANSLGLLDGAGAGSASLTLGAGFDPTLAGLQLHHAYAVIDLGPITPLFASNAVPLLLVP